MVPVLSCVSLSLSAAVTTRAAGEAGLQQPAAAAAPEQQPTPPAAASIAAVVAAPEDPSSGPDDEFDYSAELEAASAAAGEDAAASDASPSPRSPMLPPPPPVDDSPGHIREYLATVCQALLESLPGGVLPARIQPAQVCSSRGSYYHQLAPSLLSGSQKTLLHGPKNISECTRQCGTQQQQHVATGRHHVVPGSMVCLWAKGTV